MLRTGVTLFCFLILFMQQTNGQAQNNKEDVESFQKILNLTSDIIHDTDRRVGLLLTIKKKTAGTAAFEMGYLTYDIQEKFRRMVDKYNTSIFMKPKLYLVELLLYLEEIERHYWEINHISNMMHEIERKYGIKSGLHVEYDEDATSLSGGQTPPQEYENQVTRPKKKKTKFKHEQYFIEKWFSTKKTTTQRWPIDYGWEIDYDWWNRVIICLICIDGHPKMSFLLEYTVRLRAVDMHYKYTTTSKIAPQNIINELSWRAKVKVLNYPPNRRVGISMLQSERESMTKSTQNEDNHMKMKLFRLMYETIRDSDQKIKRAESIKSYYTNYSSFEIGFILGDVTDKFNVMADISSTVKKLYKIWKPVEHINAYEQITNKGIEISHLIDLIKVINKRRL